MTDTRAAEPLDRVAEIEARSAAFRRELGLATLALTQIMYVVGSGWVGTAAKLGPSHVVFWSAAILLYYLPQAAVVIYLNRLMPLEGGLYQWATEGLGKFLGFLTAWNLWAYSIAVMAVFGVDDRDESRVPHRADGRDVHEGRRGTRRS